MALSQVVAVATVRMTGLTEPTEGSGQGWEERMVCPTNLLWGAWVAQSVERLTLDSGSGRGLVACEF